MTQLNKVEPKAYKGLSGSHYTVHVWPWSTAYSQLESAVCWFFLRGENRRTRRKTLEAEKRTNTNSTHLWRRVQESNLGHIGGRRMLSPLRHRCIVIYPGRASLIPSHSLICLLLFLLIKIWSFTILQVTPKCNWCQCARRTLQAKLSLLIHQYYNCSWSLHSVI